MLVRLGWKDFKRNLLLNCLILLLLMAAFLTAMTATSAVMAKMQQYRKIQPYLEQNGVCLMASGLFHGEESLLYKDSAEIREYLPQVKDILTVTELLGATYRDKDVNAWCYSKEVVGMLSPQMEEGRYFTEEDVHADTLKAVISHNAEDIHAGDVITLHNDIIKGGDQEVEIIGVMEDGEALYQPRYYGEATKDYRQCFQAYSYEVEGKPAILINEQQILANQAKGWFPHMNYRLSDIGFMKQVNGEVILTYDDAVSEEQIQSDLSYLVGNGSMVLQRMSLSKFNANSRKYVFEDLYHLLPILVCSMIFILIAAVSAGAVSVKKNMYSYAVYYICGYRWRQCSRISMVSACVTAVTALAVVTGAVAAMQAAGRLEDTNLAIGGWQVIVCLGILLVFVAVASSLPMLIVRHASANRILRDHR